MVEGVVGSVVEIVEDIVVVEIDKVYGCVVVDEVVKEVLIHNSFTH